MEDIDELLEKYEIGKIDYKPDVQKQLKEIRLFREKQIQEQLKKQLEYNEMMKKNNYMNNTHAIQEQLNQQSIVIQQLTLENNQLKDQLDYLNNKIKILLKSQIDKLKEDKLKELHVNNIK
jgi:hypothetical protein